MKKTVKTSRVAGQLEKMYRLLNARFFNGELPEVVISLKKTVGAYGHFTCSKVWQAGDERRYEINISSATLSRAIEDTCSTLLHEMCHCFAAEKGIKDTSGSGNFYHNRISLQSKDGKTCRCARPSAFTRYLERFPKEPQTEPPRKPGNRAAPVNMSAHAAIRVYGLQRL